MFWELRYEDPNRFSSNIMIKMALASSSRRFDPIGIVLEEDFEECEDSYGGQNTFNRFFGIIHIRDYAYQRGGDYENSYADASGLDRDPLARSHLREPSRNRTQSISSDEDDIGLIMTEPTQEPESQPVNSTARAEGSFLMFIFQLIHSTMPINGTLPLDWQDKCDEAGPHPDWFDDEPTRANVIDLLIELVHNIKEFGAPPMTDVAIESLAKVPITEADVNSHTVCCICWDEFVVLNMSVMKLACNHIFHISCIWNWLREHGTCPICRLILIRPFEAFNELRLTGRVLPTFRNFARINRPQLYDELTNVTSFHIARLRAFGDMRTTLFDVTSANIHAYNASHQDMRLRTETTNVEVVMNVDLSTESASDNAIAVAVSSCNSGIATSSNTSMSINSLDRNATGNTNGATDQGPDSLDMSFTDQPSLDDGNDDVNPSRLYCSGNDDDNSGRSTPNGFTITQTQAQVHAQYDNDDRPLPSSTSDDMDDPMTGKVDQDNLDEINTDKESKANPKKK